MLTGNNSLITALAFSPSCVADPTSDNAAAACTTPAVPLLAAGAADGRILVYSLGTYTPLYRLAAHDASVSALALHAVGAGAGGRSRFLVSGGGDGRTRLFDAGSGNYIRDLTERMADGAVVKVGVGRDVCVVVGKRAGRGVVEVWGYGA